MNADIMSPIFNQIHQTLDETENTLMLRQQSVCNFKTPRIRNSVKSQLVGQTILDQYSVVNPEDIEISSPEQVHDVFVGAEERRSSFQSDNTIALLNQAALLMDQ